MADLFGSRVVTAARVLVIHGRERGISGLRLAPLTASPDVFNGLLSRSLADLSEPMEMLKEYALPICHLHTCFIKCMYTIARLACLKRSTMTGVSSVFPLQLTVRCIEVIDSLDPVRCLTYCARLQIS